jgi:alpha-acetolactate decarboxylase
VVTGLIAVLSVVGVSALLWAQPGPQGKGGRFGKDAAHKADMELFHFLLDNRKEITRKVTNLPNGIETLTESDNPKVVEKLQAHVASMYKRVEERRPIHARDPLFAEIFRNTDKIKMKLEKTRKGVKVVETSEDAYVAKLIQAHAEVVNLFLKNGRAEMMKNHALPDKKSPHEVRWFGELKNVMLKGDLKGTVDLKVLSKLPHVYAVGALEGLDGEITMLDGGASIAKVRDGKVTVSDVVQGKACVVVYAQVKNWKEVPLRKSTRSLDQLEAAVVVAATKEGINVNRPFPFLVKGKVTEAKYHVLRHPGALKDSQDLHDKAQVKFVFKDGPVELVGFYSDQHLGIFTCGGNLHVHLRSADGKLSGHVDEVDLGSEMRLFLPLPLAR